MLWKATAIFVLVYVPIASLFNLPKVWLWSLAGVPAWGCLLGVLLACEAYQRWMLDDRMQYLTKPYEVPGGYRESICLHIWEHDVRLGALEKVIPRSDEDYDDFKRRRAEIASRAPRA